MDTIKIGPFRLHKPRPDALVASFAAAFVCAALFALLKSDNFLDLSQTVQNLPVGAFIAVFLIALLVFSAAYLLTGWLEIPAISLSVVSVFFAAVLAAKNEANAFFCAGLALIILIVFKWTSRDDRLMLDRAENRLKSWKIVWIAGACLFVLYTVLIAWHTSLKYSTFSNFTFDFGIFAQMFERMRLTGLPMTTVERSTELTHFAVHFSPIYYLFLPGYLLFHTPHYLFWIQAAATGAGLFAVILICKKLEQSPLFTLIASVLYVFYPSIGNGCFYDFHENKFLTVCILWLLYFILAENRVGTVVFALATLCVKEDAALYLFAVAVWMFVTRKKKQDRIMAAVLFAMGVAYYLFATAMIRHYGGEPMLSRFDDYMVGSESGLLAVAKNILLDFGYLLSNLFTADRAEFVIWMLLCVLGAPFLHSAASNLILIAPMIVINLMQTWTYQYDVDYQYTYGVAALVLFASLLSIAQMKPEKRKKFLLCAAAVCIIFTSSLVLPKMQRYSNRYNGSKEVYREVEDLIRTVPADVSVTATSSLCPHLYFVKDLHTVPDYYAEMQQTDYYVVDTRYSGTSSYSCDSMVKNSNYIKIRSAGFVDIYIRADLYDPLLFADPTQP
ncbi:MAG: DUF2079 domain-containing protein [Clostridia bacterium]|nr:DUF2079 domain-containing protein [Clostridia bacterium]